MTLARIYRWIRKVYSLLVLLAAIFGVQPGHALPLPTAPQMTSPVVPAPPVPPPPAKKVIGSCATGEGRRADGSTGFYAVCVVDGASFTLPGDYSTRAAAQQAIRDFRAANA